MTEAQLYRKLRWLMSCNHKDTWEYVCEIASVGCYMSFEDFDHHLEAYESTKNGQFVYPSQEAQETS